MLNFSVVHQRHLHVWIGQCDARERFGDMSAFGLRRLQKFLTNRSVVKQLSNFDRRSHWATTRLNRFVISAVDDQFKSAI